MRPLIFLLLMVMTSVVFPSSLEIIHKPDKAFRAKLVAIARTYLSVPYQWAGEDRGGLDCSAFIQEVLSHAGYRGFPRVVKDQVLEGEVLHGPLLPGDLVFFDTQGRGPSHVGIYSGKGKIIHSASDGDYQGVVESSLSAPYYKKHFYQSRRLFPERLQVALRLDSQELETEPIPLEVNSLELILTSNVRKNLKITLYQGELPQMSRTLVVSPRERSYSFRFALPGEWEIRISQDDRVISRLPIDYSPSGAL